MNIDGSIQPQYKPYRYEPAAHQGTHRHAHADGERPYQINRFVKCAEFVLGRVGINAHTTPSYIHKICWIWALALCTNKPHASRKFTLSHRQQHRRTRAHRKAFYKCKTEPSERRVACTHFACVCANAHHETRATKSTTGKVRQCWIYFNWNYNLNNHDEYVQCAHTHACTAMHTSWKKKIKSHTQTQRGRERERESAIQREWAI